MKKWQGGKPLCGSEEVKEVAEVREVGEMGLRASGFGKIRAASNKQQATTQSRL
jgi:hypothetical protein